MTLLLAWIWRTSDQDVRNVDQQSHGASGNGLSFEASKHGTVWIGPRGL